MSSQPNKLVAVISRLTRLTQEGIINWKRLEPPEHLMQGTDNIIKKFYIAEYEDHTIGIYELNYKEFDGETDDFYWLSKPVLALLRLKSQFFSTYEKEWEFPYVTGTDNLLRSVEYQVSNAGAFIERILQESHSTTA